MAFSISGGIHAATLLAVAFGPVTPPERPKSLYDQEIRPHEDRIVWYPLRNRLPEISPSASEAKKPLRAQVKSDQTMVAGKKDDPNRRTMIWMPEPPVPVPKPRELPKLPNLVAVAPAKALRPFTPALDKPAPAPSLPDAPRVTTPQLPRPYTPPPPVRQTRAFTPPPAAKPKTVPLRMPDAPEVALVVPAETPAYVAPTPERRYRQFTPPPEAKPKAAPVRLTEPPQVAIALPTQIPEYAAPTLPRAHRPFTPPPQAKLKTAATPEVPDAPAVVTTIPAPIGHFEAPSRPLATRKFTAPPQPAPRTGPTAALPDAPSVAAATGAAGGGLGAIGPGLPAPPRKSFTAPTAHVSQASTASLPEAPAAGDPLGTDGSAEATLAIAGLDPAKTMDIPKPPAPREGGFSAGPEKLPDKRSDGTAGGDGKIVVPGLTVREGASDTKDDRPTLVGRTTQDPRLRLVAVLHMPLGSLPPPPPDTPEAHAATRVSSAPDPLLEGRAVYTMAIQMPNVTSFSGSWMVWFAERAQTAVRAAIQAPVPRRKVDPKYIVAAVDERIEGTVRLAAVIRQDGHVDSVKLVRSLDPRLDHSAMTALVQWEFEPARSGGVPIDIDAVFEIPFHLAPKLKK